MNINNVGNIHKYWNNHPLIASMIVFVFVFSTLFLVYFVSSGDPIVGDKYFHFKYASLLRTEGIDAVQHFNWINSSNMPYEGSRYAVNLFQVSLIPFTYFSDWLFAIHIVDVFQISMAISLIYYVMHKSRVRYPLFFTFILLTSAYFVLRLLIGRAYVLAVALIFVEMFFAIEKKYKSLLAVTIFHILWHQNTYFMPLVVVSIVEASRYLVYQKFFIKNFIATAVGVVIGMAFFPGFPLSLVGWMQDIFKIQSTDVADIGSLSIGGTELVSKDFMSHFVAQEIFLALFIFGIIATLFIYILQKKSDILFDNLQNQKHVMWIYALFIFMISTTFGTLIISGRFFDFLIPSIFILSAFIVTIIVNTKKIIIEDNLRKWLIVGVWIFAIIIVSNVFISVYAAANKFDYKPVGDAAQWIQKNSIEGEKVFLHNWGNFTLMFFGNSDNVYSMGIEPMSLKNYDEGLYWKYYNIFMYNYYCDAIGDCKEQLEVDKKVLKTVSNDVQKEVEKINSRKIINSIKNDFGSKIIVSDSNAFTVTILLNPDLIESYQTFTSDKFKGKFSEFTVFKLK